MFLFTFFFLCVFTRRLNVSNFFTNSFSCTCTQHRVRIAQHTQRIFSLLLFFFRISYCRKLISIASKTILKLNCLARTHALTTNSIYILIRAVDLFSASFHSLLNIFLLFGNKMKTEKSERNDTKTKEKKITLLI